MRKEHDFLGELEVADELYYGVQTIRALENFNITGKHLDQDFIKALAMVKKASALANMKTGRLNVSIGKAIVQAADEVIEGKFADQFPVDAFPTAIKVCAILKSKPLLEALQRLVDELEKKAEEYSGILKMGRTHLQDAVPITLGQEMGAYASGIRRGIKRIKSAVEGAHVINMGATAVGTGLNAEPNYIHDVAYELSEVVGEPFYTAENLIDATNNTDIFADISSGLKVTALVLIKMANDFRLMASGPRCGIGELKLPARQPGSSIMPGKVNPVIAEVLNQVCYQVIGNDLTITLAVENGQFELNVMEPVLAYNLFNNLCYLKNGVNTFVDKLLIDLEVDREQCEYWLNRSVGIVTALLPHLGYETASALAKEAYETGRAIRDIILDQGLLTEDEINHILSPKEMTRPGIAGANLLKQKGN